MPQPVHAPAPTAQHDRRGLTAAAAGCVLSGSVVLLAVGRVWMRYTVDQPPLSSRPASATGHTVAAAAATLALVILAGVVVFPATRGIGRRVAGVAVALAGLGVGYAAFLTIVFTTDQVPGVGSGRLLDERTTLWPWVALVAGVLGAGCGFLAVVSSSRWPSMGRRYESASATAKTGPLTDVGMWDRLDEGDDPTA
jgi:Tryptophan-associated transmembrane protein (Trp_oprn_chp)